MSKSRLIIEKLQGGGGFGGNVTVTSPLGYTAIQTTPVDTSKLSPIVLQRKAPKLAKEDLGELKGYTSDVIRKTKEFNALQSQLESLPEFLYTTEGTRILTRMKQIFSGPSQQQLLNAQEDGKKAREAIKKGQNDSADTWLNTGDGRVVVLENGRVAAYDLATAANKVRRREASRITGKEGYSVRNEIVNYDDPNAQLIIDAMKGTLGASKVYEWIDGWKTDKKNSKSYSGAALQRIDNNASINKTGVSQLLFGKVSTTHTETSNEANYAIATKGAWRDMSQNLRTTLKAEVAQNLNQVSREAFLDAGINPENTEELKRILNSTESDDIAKVNRLLENGAKERVIDRLAKEVEHKVVNKQDVNVSSAFNSALGIGGGSGGTPQKAGLVELTANFMGTNKNFQIQNAQGKGIQFLAGVLSNSALMPKGKAAISLAESDVPNITTGTIELADGTQLTQSQSDILSTGLVITKSGEAAFAYVPYKPDGTSILTDINDQSKQQSILDNSNRLVELQQKYRTETDPTKRDQISVEMNSIQQELQNTLGENVDQLTYKKKFIVNAYVTEEALEQSGIEGQVEKNNLLKPVQEETLFGGSETATSLMELYKKSNTGDFDPYAGFDDLSSMTVFIDAGSNIQIRAGGDQKDLRVDPQAVDAVFSHQHDNTHYNVDLRPRGEGSGSSALN